MQAKQISEGSLHFYHKKAFLIFPTQLLCTLKCIWRQVAVTQFPWLSIAVAKGNEKTNCALKVFFCRDFCLECPVSRLCNDGLFNTSIEFKLEIQFRFGAYKTVISLLSMVVLYSCKWNRLVKPDPWYI